MLHFGAMGLLKFSFALQLYSHTYIPAKTILWNVYLSGIVKTQGEQGQYTVNILFIGLKFLGT